MFSCNVSFTLVSTNDVRMATVTFATPTVTWEELSRQIARTKHPLEVYTGQLWVDGLAAPSGSAITVATAEVVAYVTIRTLSLTLHDERGGLSTLNLTREMVTADDLLRAIESHVNLWMTLEETLMGVSQTVLETASGNIPWSTLPCLVIVRGPVRTPAVTFQVNELKRSFHLPMPPRATVKDVLNAIQTCPYNPNPAVAMESVMCGGVNLLGRSLAEVIDTSTMNVVVNLPESVISVPVNILHLYSETLELPAICTGAVIHRFLNDFLPTTRDDRVKVHNKRRYPILRDASVYIMRNERLFVFGEGICSGVSIRPRMDSSRPFESLSAELTDTYGSMLAKAKSVLARRTATASKTGHSLPADMLAYLNGRLYDEANDLALGYAVPMLFVFQPPTPSTASKTVMGAAAAAAPAKNTAYIDIQGLGGSSDIVRVQDFPFHSTYLGVQRYLYNHRMSAAVKSTHVFKHVRVNGFEIIPHPAGVNGTTTLDIEPGSLISIELQRYSE